eukprot:1238644-Rhodomonas_salina.1
MHSPGLCTSDLLEYPKILDWAEVAGSCPSTRVPGYLGNARVHRYPGPGIGVPVYVYPILAILGYLGTRVPGTQVPGTQ